MLKSRKKLTIWSALPPYLGGKRRLCGTIFREIHRLISRRLWARLTFLDGFLGGGSVSLYAKAQGFRVVATDIAERSIVIGRALIENSRVRLTREDVLRLAADDGRSPGRIERSYVPSVFTRGQAQFIDRALVTAAATGDAAKAALYKLLAIRVALLAHPYSQVRKGTIHRLATGEYESITESAVYHYVDGLRLTRPEKLWTLAQQINAGVLAGEGRVIQGNVLELLPTIEGDVAYFDPPYPGVMSYEKEYRIIDEILEGAVRATSPFTAKDGAAMIDGLFERARHIPIWLLSLGNAVVTIGELEEKMRRLGRETRAIEIKYQHLPAVATDEKKATNREFLVVGWDTKAALLRDLSVKRLGMADRVADAEVPRTIPEVHVNVDAIGAKGPALKAGAADPFEDGEPRLAKQAIPLDARDALAIDDPRLDVPDPVLAEARLDRGREGGLGAPLSSHVTRVQWDGAAGQVRKETHE